MLGFVILFSNFLISQNQQLELTVSNDKFVFTDRYYTSGLHLTYRKGLNSDLLFFKKEDNKLQVNVMVGNETYTPKNLTSFNNQNFDRPYAGWLFGKIELGQIKQKSALFLALESGVTGEESLAGKLQIALHEFLDINSRPTWVDEISYNWLFNFKTVYINDIQINKNNSIQNHISASIGTKDTYIGNDVYYFFGNFSDFQNTSRLNLVDVNQTKEFFGFISAGYKYVALNALIQGHVFNDEAPFTLIAANHILKFSAGAVLRTKKNVFKIGYYYNTKETISSSSHVYGAFTFGFLF
ncbi:hypothetical protein GCM10023311_17180 [Flaviramulus aquimarinus]|uniref:Lipid A deacylase LpxR family protein n=1 Tax=Flaviramulus aquimarinus TaxID=1170456 RepID=A0ABP9F5B1_9FLAO